MQYGQVHECYFVNDILVYYLIVKEQFGSFEISRGNADIVLLTGMVELSQAPVNQSQLTKSALFIIAIIVISIIIITKHRIIAAELSGFLHILYNTIWGFFLQEFKVLDPQSLNM